MQGSGLDGRFAKWTSPFLKGQYSQNLSTHYGEVAEESTKPIKVISDPFFKH